MSEKTTATTANEATATLELNPQSRSNTSEDTVSDDTVFSDTVSGDAATQRIEQAIERIEQLAALLDEDYEPGQIAFEVPADWCLSVVIPVFNEAKTIELVLARVLALPVPKEVVVVDDFSTDGTRDVLRQLEGADNLRVIYKSQNEGKGAALRSGFAEVRGSVVVVQDADLEYDPRDILQLLGPIIKGEADVVYGSRFLGDEQQDPSWLHRFGNRVLTVTSNLTTGLRLTDMETCYKVFSKNVLHGFKIEQNRFGFEPEVTAKIARRGYRIQELPISYNSRGYEEGKKIGIKDAISAFYCIARYAFVD